MQIERWGWAVCAILLLATAPCLADAPTGDAAAARRHYEEGVKLFDLQHYAEAALEYELAFAERPDPALLYNIGQAYRLAHTYDKALGAFKSYLRRVPTAPNRADVERRIAELEVQAREQHAAEEQAAREREAAARAEQERVAEQRRLELEVQLERERAAQAERARAGAGPTVHRAAPDARTGRRLKWAGVGTAAAGALILGAGAALFAVGRRAADQIDHPADGAVFDPTAESRGKTLQPAGIALLSLGAVAAVGGVALAVIGWRAQRAGRRAQAPVSGAVTF